MGSTKFSTKVPTKFPLPAVLPREGHFEACYPYHPCQANVCRRFVSLVVLGINTMTFVAPIWPVARREEGASPPWGCNRRATKPRPNSAQPAGRQVFFAQTSLLAPYRSTSGYARRSRLVWAKNPLPRTSSYLSLRPLSLASE